jgi:far upstream element-binding protein
LQVIPLHLPPGDPATERTLYIDGTTEQIEIAKQLVSEVTSEVSISFLVICYLPVALLFICLVKIFLV